MTNRTIISLVLTLVALILGGISPGLLLADFGPPMAVRIPLALLPFTVLPFVIAWLTPKQWWLALVPPIIPVLLAALLLLTSMPRSLVELWGRAPLFLPPVLTIIFALLGKFISQLQQRKHSPNSSS